MAHPLPPKKEVALALLERSSVHMHLDPRLSGVVVPPWFKKQAQLVLQIGLNMPVPIPDLRLDDEGMSCTLSFNRSPFFCVVPWPSVFAMVGDDGRGMIWPDDVPPEVQAQGQQSPRLDARPQRRPQLEAVKNESPKPKRPRKKPQIGRVPAADGPTPIASPPRERLAPVPNPRSPAPSRGAAPRKPKRELPPYLRVVK